MQSLRKLRSQKSALSGNQQKNSHFRGEKRFDFQAKY